MSAKYHNHSGGYIGVDLDATLAQYNGYVSPDHIGEPIPLMLERVKKWLADGVEVRIITARVHATTDDPEEVAAVKLNRLYIEAYLLKHLGQKLPIQSFKCYKMFQLWDDRAVQVIPNTGMRADGKD